MLLEEALVSSVVSVGSGFLLGVRCVYGLWCGSTMLSEQRGLRWSCPIVSAVVCGGVASVESSRTTMTSSKNFNNSLVHSYSITLMFAVWWAGCIVCHDHFFVTILILFAITNMTDACSYQRPIHHTFQYKLTQAHPTFR